MILLSESGEYQYFAIEVPKSAKRIFLDGVHSYSKRLYYFTDDSHHIQLGYDELGYGAIEILGVIGAGEEISEEVAEEATIHIEIPEWSKYTESNPHPDNYTHVLIWMLEQRGILVENPMEKPDPLNPGFLSTTFEDDLKEWQSYESRLVKAVIIKVKR